MCDHDVFDSWAGGHHCQTMPHRFWIGPVMVGQITGPAFAHYGECGWTIGGVGLFAAWIGWWHAVPTLWRRSP